MSLSVPFARHSAYGLALHDRWKDSGGDRLVFPRDQGHPGQPDQFGDEGGLLPETEFDHRREVQLRRQGRDGFERPLARFIVGLRGWVGGIDDGGLRKISASEAGAEQSRPASRALPGANDEGLLVAGALRRQSWTRPRFARLLGVANDKNRERRHGDRSSLWRSLSVGASRVTISARSSSP